MPRVFAGCDRRMLSTKLHSLPGSGSAEVALSSRRLRSARMQRVSLATVLVLAILAGASARELECDVCRKVAQVVESVLVRNATATGSFADVAGALCQHLPETTQSVCTDAINDLDLDVFRCMIQEVDFRTLCSDPAVALCKAPSEPYRAAIPCHGMLPQVPTCAACRFAISGMQQYVNDTSSMIVQSVGADICRFHFERNDLKQMCRVVMSSFGDIMLRVLTARLDAEDFCCELGLCDTPLNTSGEKWTTVNPTA